MRYIPDIISRLYEASPVWTRPLASTLYGVLKSRKETGRLFWEYYRQLEESQWWSADRLEEFQADRLRALVKHCAQNVPYYRTLFAEHGITPSQIQAPADLPKVPILTKETVRTCAETLFADTHDRSTLLRETTSGTTGTPLALWMNREAYLHGKALEWLHHSWGGYTHTEWVGIIAGYRVIPPGRRKPPYWVTNVSGKQVHFSTLHLRHDTFRVIGNKIRSAGLRFLMGYPSAIGLLAHHLSDSGETFPLRAVFLGSEPVFDWQVAAIERAFTCKVFNLYGQSERALSATSCGMTPNLHLNMEVSVGEFVEDPACSSRKLLVGTSLTNYGMPLLRYYLDDISDHVSSPCPCGRAHPLIRPVESHEDSFVLRPDGSYVSPSLLYASLHHLTGVLEAQIVQDDVRHIDVNVVTDGTTSADQRARLVRDLTTMFEGFIRVDVREVKQIPRTEGGKFRFVVSHVSQSTVGARPT
jgi:phenylacetate-CoA ligase